MTVFNTDIPPEVANSLNKELKNISTFKDANAQIYSSFGIKHFFENQDEFQILRETIDITYCVVAEPNRVEYGDFQTNIVLANSITDFLKDKEIFPKVIIEPTCGKGNFIIASLESFPNLENIIGIEIYKPYVWETKFNIIEFYLNNPLKNKPEIELFHFNIFDFDFKEMSKRFSKEDVLIIGNPPWVTNSKLSSLESNNLPEKSNFKKHNGLDAMTGKGNFDIGEYIALKMIEIFQHTKGHFAFLVKDSVIKNVAFYQKQHCFNISDLQKLKIDSKKEFDVSVDASLLLCKLNSTPEFVFNEYDFNDNSKTKNQFGWVDDKFVSNVRLYKDSSGFDGVCPFEWRQGVKHDLSSIMELKMISSYFINGLHQEVPLEEDLVYGILKSSDLKEPVISKTRKFTIITQRKIGQDTAFIKKEFPKTFDYLQKNKSKFNSRKSSIYNNKPAFSIFGVGDYSFAPYKVCISGLYKTPAFSLVLPQNGKPVMLDDTCYFLGFENLNFTAFTLILLNSEHTKALLKSITFQEAKRIYTKDILMRIDLYKLALQFSMKEIQEEIEKLNEKYELGIEIDDWEKFVVSIKPKEKIVQLKIF